MEVVILVTLEYYYKLSAGGFLKGLKTVLFFFINQSYLKYSNTLKIKADL